jgi:hypothetical protein
VKIAISQPTFFPWQGYFALIDFVDEFIFLDNVQFDKRSWQQRNYIMLNGARHLMTIPVISKNKFTQKIIEVEIDYNNFKVLKFLKTIERAYKKSKYFDLYFGRIEKIINYKYKFLSQLNINIIESICGFLNIGNKLSKASSLNLDSSISKIDQLDFICKKKKTDQYISTTGSAEYLGNMKQFFHSKANINYFHYNTSNYRQLGETFIPNLSIIDLLFNQGPDSIKIIKKNFTIIKN